MKKNKEVSIIIPCYNVEEFIEKCLDSIIKQITNFNYEIILIDDCSKDNTKKIIKKYIADHNYNIMLIENETNKGAGYSRNKAIKKAKYENISFIDADDVLDNNYYEAMLNNLGDNDLILCDIYTVFKDSNKNHLHKGCTGQINKINIIDQGLAASPCNKIIKKNMLLKYPFAEGIMNEDVPCILSIIANSNKIAYIDSTKYNYIQHEKSVQNSPLSEKKLDIIKALDLFESRIKDNNDYEKIMDIVIFHQIIEFFLYIPNREKKTIKRAKFLKKFYKGTKKYNINNNNLLKEFYKNASKKTYIYYSTIINLNNKGLSLTTSVIITLYNYYKKVTSSKTYIKNNLTIEDIVKKAKIQSEKKKDKELSVTVVIPNYNYEKFLLQRVYSILNQSKKLDEVIILDDCSTDNSRQLIDEIISKTQKYINIKKNYNKINSGCVFKQWEKAFNLASSKYVWIAEADDYCEKNFLKNHFKLLKKDNNIVLSYVDTAFIDKDGHKILKTIKNEIDILKTGHWNKSYITDGNDEISNYSYLNCTIANVSSVLFKKDDYSEVFKLATKYKQVGDWRFYLGVYEKGNIAYINKPLNYYRVHGSNVTSLTKKQKHFDEIKQLHEEISKKIKLSKKQKQNIEKRYEFLRRAWNIEK